MRQRFYPKIYCGSLKVRLLLRQKRVEHRPTLGFVENTPEEFRETGDLPECFRDAQSPDPINHSIYFRLFLRLMAYSRFRASLRVEYSSEYFNTQKGAPALVEVVLPAL